MIYDNTKAFKLDNRGLVIGVQLTIENVPGQTHIITHLRLVDEIEAKGKTEAICSSPDRQDFYMGWPYRRGNIEYANYALPGNSNGIHIITNGYSPPDYGYLAIQLGKPSVSQIVGGLGLPYNRHVAFEIAFGRLIDPIDPIDPNLPDTELLKRVDKIERFLLSLPLYKDFK